MAKITTDYSAPEGLFFPDTYLFAKGASDLQIYKQAYALLQKRLNEAWAGRDAGLAVQDAVRGADHGVDRGKGNRAETPSAT